MDAGNTVYNDGDLDDELGAPCEEAGEEWEGVIWEGEAGVSILYSFRRNLLIKNSYYNNYHHRHFFLSYTQNDVLMSEKRTKLLKMGGEGVS